jgi:hypothetical protein
MDAGQVRFQRFSYKELDEETLRALFDHHLRLWAELHPDDPPRQLEAARGALGGDTALLAHLWLAGAAAAGRSGGQCSALCHRYGRKPSPGADRT